ncbi:MAG: hypothetical protein AB7O50_05880 [Pseudolabrys sp.]
MTDISEEWQPVYVGIMQEIVLRGRVIETLFSEDLELGIRPRFEFCHLELRMMCELFAISSLIAHGDIPATQSKRIESIWQADRLLRTMSHLHPDFFPAATKVTIDENGSMAVLDRPEAIVTKDEVIELYNECGNVLHRGNLKTFGQIETNTDDFFRSRWWGQRLNSLALSHTISAYGSGAQTLWHVTVSDDEYLKPRILKLTRLPPAH